MHKFSSKQSINIEFSYELIFEKKYISFEILLRYSLFVILQLLKSLQTKSIFISPFNIFTTPFICFSSSDLDEYNILSPLWEFKIYGILFLRIKFESSRCEVNLISYSKNSLFDDFIQILSIAEIKNTFNSICLKIELIVSDDPEVLLL